VSYVHKGGKLLDVISSRVSYAQGVMPYREDRYAHGHRHIGHYQTTEFTAYSTYLSGQSSARESSVSYPGGNYQHW
jgi:hypothetical protein